MPSGAPVRVARLITRLNIGGPAIQAIELSSRLTSRGFETLLLHGRVGDAEGDMRYLLERADPPPGIAHVATLQRPIAPANDARAFAQIYRALCAFKPAIVHTHMAKAGALGRVATIAYNKTAGRGAPARIVHTYHGHVLEGYFSPAKTRLFLDFERRLARLTDRIVAISPRIRVELLQHHHIGRESQYRVIPLGFDLAPLLAIDAPARGAARAALGIPDAAVVVSTVGRLTAIKDQQLFLEVLARVNAGGAPIVGLVAGDGELRAELEASAAALGVADRVRFLGWRRDLAVVYGATDVFLLTSRNEGTPVALIESLAAGCAGVSTNVGGVADVVTGPDVGLLAPAGDADQLAHHVSGLAADPARRRSMGEAGRQSMAARYGIERLVDDVGAMYRDLLAQDHFP